MGRFRGCPTCLLRGHSSLRMRHCRPRSPGCRRTGCGSWRRDRGLQPGFTSTGPFPPPPARQHSVGWRPVSRRMPTTWMRVNYRTSHQIRRQADRLLSPELSDVDGNVETRDGTISAFEGPDPEIHAYGSPDLEIGAAASWLKLRIGEQVQPHEIGVFVRSEDQYDRAEQALAQANLQAHLVRASVDSEVGKVPCLRIGHGKRQTVLYPVADAASLAEPASRSRERGRR